MLCYSSWMTTKLFCHTVPLTISYPQLRFLIGLYSVVQIWYFIKEINENDKNSFLDERQLQQQQQQQKC